MRHADGFQTTLSCGPVNSQGQTFALDLNLQLTGTWPTQDRNLPGRIEEAVHQAGLDVRRRLFALLIEKADKELLLQARHGEAGKGIQRRGTRPFTFKTLFGDVTVPRTRISHKHDGSIETPSATAWRTPHQLAITDNLRDAACDQMGRLSVTKTRRQIGRQAGQDDLLGRGTILELVHRQGEQLVAAERQRAEATLAEIADDQRTRLGLPLDPMLGGDSEDIPPPPEDLAAEAGLAEPTEPTEPGVTGLPSGEPAFPVMPGEPRQVDPGVVMVEPDEVKTKAQPHTARKEVWTFTAVVLVAGCAHLLSEASPADLWWRVGALLAELGVLKGDRRLLVLGDGAAWIRVWFAQLELPGKAMILCWWHLRQRCHESLSLAGGPKACPKELERAVPGRLWRGRVDEVIAGLEAASAWVNHPGAVATLIGYLEKRRAFLPDYQERQRAGLWIASTRVEKLNDWAVSDRCKHHGMSWTPHGVLGLASLEVARRNGELDHWRKTGELPERLATPTEAKAA